MFDWGKDLGGIFGGSDNNDYSGASSYYDPYAQWGQQGGANLATAGDEFADPMAAWGNFSKNYQMSPGAQAQLKSGMDAISNSMASQGLQGSGTHQKALATFANNLVASDMSQQWNNILNGGRFGANVNNRLFQGGLSSATNQAGLREAEENAAAQGRQNQRSGIWGLAGDLFGATGAGDRLTNWLGGLF